MRSIFLILTLMFSIFSFSQIKKIELDEVVVAKSKINALDYAATLSPTTKPFKLR
jgi:hypothetical protein